MRRVPAVVVDGLVGDSPLCVGRHRVPGVLVRSDEWKRAARNLDPYPMPGQERVREVEKPYPVALRVARHEQLGPQNVISKPGANNPYRQRAELDCSAILPNVEDLRSEVRVGSVAGRVELNHRFSDHLNPLGERFARVHEYVFAALDRPMVERQILAVQS